MYYQITKIMEFNKNNKVYKPADITKILLRGEQLPDGSRSINPHMDYQLLTLIKMNK